MTDFTATDGNPAFCKGWRPTHPSFSPKVGHCHRTWDQQMLFFGENGFRGITHDRRSHGHSDHTWNGNNVDQYTDDLAELIDALDLGDLILVGHSTGGGEAPHYIGRHGTAHVAKVVLVGAVPPLMLKTDSNPHGTALSAFGGIRERTAKNRSQFFYDLAVPFYGFNRDRVGNNEGFCESLKP